MMAAALAAGAGTVMTAFGLYTLTTGRIPPPNLWTRSIHRPHLYGLGQIFIGPGVALLGLMLVVPELTDPATDWSLTVSRLLFVLTIGRFLTGGGLLFSAGMPRRTPGA